MFLLSKIITAFILPPGLILTSLIPVLILIRKNRTGTIFLVLILLLFYSLSINPAADALLRPLEAVSAEPSAGTDADPEMVVVLGGGSILRGGDNRITSITRERLLEGVLLSRELDLPLHFSGGNVLKGKGAPGEGAGASALLERMNSGIRYSIEVHSRNTYENARYTAEMIAPRNIILVTSAFHMKRSVACFEKAGFQIIQTVAVDYRIDEKERGITDFLPSPKALDNSSTALKEYWGLAYYRLRGFL